MTRIVTTHYRYKRPPRKRKAVAIEGPAIVRAADPAKARKRAAKDALANVSHGFSPTVMAANDDHGTPAKSAIVTIRRRGKRFADVPDVTPEEHQRRGDAADAIWRELMRRVPEGRTP
jgi:hypothetical protein